MLFTDARCHLLYVMGAWWTFQAIFTLSDSSAQGIAFPSNIKDHSNKLCDFYLINDINTIHVSYLIVRDQVREAVSQCVREKEAAIMCRWDELCKHLDGRDNLQDIVPDLQSYESTSLMQSDHSTSHELNVCAARAANSDLWLKEILLRVALAVDLANISAAKNLAYLLEWHGWTNQARDILDLCVDIARDFNCRVQRAFLAPIAIDMAVIQDTYDEGLLAFHRIMKECHDILSMESNEKPFDVSMISGLRELPLPQQYIGHSPGILAVLFYRIIQTHLMYKQHLIPSRNVEIGKRKKRIGIVAEHEGNSSPALCFMVNSNQSIAKLFDSTDYYNMDYRISSDISMRMRKI